MADRTYTTKTRAKRIALEYFKRPHPFRRAKFLLSVALPAVAALVLAGFALSGDHRLYTSGPVSMAHAMFGARCSECHAAAPAGAGAAPAGAGAAPAAAGVASRAAFFVPVSNETCSVCHKGPEHHGHQKFVPTCSSCHFEHKGREHLVAFGDRQCTQCHDNLTTKGFRTKDAPPPTFAAKIAGFQSGHPQFSVAQTGSRARVKLDDPTPPTDTAQVCLDHKTHLKAFRAENAPWYRPGPGGTKGVVDTKEGLRLTCTYCHQPDGQGAYMEPISYRKHCADCHPLLFDNDKFAEVKAPHDQPEIVHAFLRTKYTEFPDGVRSAKPVAKEPAAEKVDEEAGRPRRRLGGREEPEDNQPRRGRLGGGRGEPEEKPQPKTPKGFKDVEALLFFKNKENSNTCQLCHTLLTVPGKPEPAASCGETNAKRLRDALKDDRGNEKLPAVAETAIPARWLPHSRFDHRAHRPFKCTECHQAEASKMTADVLLPKIETCRKCHRDAGGARAACVECHLYHDKTKERDLDGPLKVEKLALDGSARPGGGSR